MTIHRTELEQYEDQIKYTIDKMLKGNGYPKLELKKNNNGQYTVALEDLSLIFASMVSDSIKKNGIINQLKQEINSMSSMKQDMDISTQFKDLQVKYNEEIKQIKNLENN